MRSNAFCVTRTRLRSGALAVALALGAGAHQPRQPGCRAVARGGAAEFKLDSELRHRIANGRRQEARRVIVRVKPGAAQRAQGLFKALGQQGAHGSIRSINAFRSTPPMPKRSRSPSTSSRVSLDADDARGAGDSGLDGERGHAAADRSA